MIGYIYKTTNLINNKIYIGKKKGKFTEKYKGSGKYLKNAINKYGIENFKVEIIEYCETLEEQNEKEKYWIAYYRNKNAEMYNIADGGDGGDIFSTLSLEEQNNIKNKLSNSITGRIFINNGKIEKCPKLEDLEKFLSNGYIVGTLYSHIPTEETRLKISRTLLGKYKGIGQTEETKQLKSKLLKERYRNGWQNPMKGKEPYNKGEKGVWFWYTNGIDNLRLKFNEIIPEGYVRGRTITNKISDSTREKLSKVTKNTIWVHNNNHNKRINPELLNSYLQNGYILGKHSKN